MDDANVTLPYELLEKIMGHLDPQEINLLKIGLKDSEEYPRADEYADRLLEGMESDLPILDWAAFNGYIDIMEWEVERGAKLTSETLNYALEGNLEVIKYIHEAGVELPEDTIRLAARNNYLDLLKYAHKNGVPWHYQTTYWAARNNNLAMMKYAHERGAPWDNNTIFVAAQYGNLKMVKYALKNGAPINSSPSSRFEATFGAALGGNLDILKYLVKNEAKWDKHILDAIYASQDKELIKYVKKMNRKINKNIFRKRLRTAINRRS